MGQYVVTIAAPWMVWAFLHLLVFLEAPESISTLSVAALIVAISWTFLGLWGIASIWIAEKREALATEEVVEIPDDSWHYRFNKWVDKSWSAPPSECRYWAETFNGMLVVVPVSGVILGVVYLVAFIIKFAFVWPFGLVISYVPNWEDWNNVFERSWFEKDPDRFDGSSHQKEGPVLACLAVFGLLAANSAVVIPAVVGLLVGGTVLILLAKPLWNALSAFGRGTSSVLMPIADWLIMRTLVCRRVRVVHRQGAATP